MTEADGKIQALPTERRRKGRSPSYPGISLGKAVERARAFYEHERGRRWAPMSVITSTWGFRTPTTGPASVSYAALKKFGLLEEEGAGADRKARLSELAMEILMKPDPLPSIQQAALRPPIHRELWDEYGHNLPSNDTLRWRLVGQLGFTESGFEEFIRVYRETVTFAKLHDDAAAEADNRGQADTSTHESATPEPAGSTHSVQTSMGTGSGGASPSPVRIPVLLVGGAVITVEGAFPITEAAWDQLLAVLQAMKPGLVESEPVES